MADLIIKSSSSSSKQHITTRLYAYIWCSRLPWILNSTHWYTINGHNGTEQNATTRGTYAWRRVSFGLCHWKHVSSLGALGGGIARLHWITSGNQPSWLELSAKCIPVLYALKSSISTSLLRQWRMFASSYSPLHPSSTLILYSQRGEHLPLDVLHTRTMNSLQRVECKSWFEKSSSY